MNRLIILAFTLLAIKYEVSGTSSSSARTISRDGKLQKPHTPTYPAAGRRHLIYKEQNPAAGLRPQKGYSKGKSESMMLRASSTSARTIPRDVKMGVATAAYQIEGAWDEDGKSESIWDHLMHENPCFTVDCKNGDVATNSYQLYERDVEMLRELGVDHYRFSIAWTRILPEGFGNKVNEAGLAHYNKFIDELLKYGIEPIVTIYHWDIPQVLQTYGGWLNPLSVDWFGDYARVLYKSFGDRVKKWVTINEPFQICFYGFEEGTMAPALNLSGVGVYICSKNILLAHARAWHIYDDEFRQSQDGIVGLSINTELFTAEFPENTEAAQILNEFFWDIYAHPIFSETGDYPAKMKIRIAEKSATQGFARSRLPDFSSDEILYLKGSSDFFGMNHYSTYYAYSNASTKGVSPSPSWNDDADAAAYQPAEWDNYEGEYFKIVPWGFSEVLGIIREKYNNPPILITENGYSYPTRGLIDDYRILFYHGYLNALLDAIEDGSNIIGYTAWSLMDNFEWRQGYTQCFGLFEVDLNSTNYTRTTRNSAKYYRRILQSRQITRV